MTRSRNEYYVRDSIGVASIVDTNRVIKLRWFGYVMKAVMRINDEGKR